MAFWASTTQLVPKDENCNIKDILESLKEKHYSRRHNKDDILYNTISDTEWDHLFRQVIRANMA